MGDNQSVTFEAESLAGACALQKLWNYTIFGVDTEDAAYLSGIMSLRRRFVGLCKEYLTARTEVKSQEYFAGRCSLLVEHGSIYLERVLASRGEKPDSQSVESTEDEVKLPMGRL